ncbi:DUF3422 family protein [Poseidonocella sedimentorum]|uniref:Uncharacterized membrane-anchored protein n=1 Tax=Poseidonocella sedimentorum TaxID=871652 RepID=A0A1I6CR68_9RHOB|nr:DUF3422 domain-containing protein [Poseidonocella sedimentorum]SFQ95587.1 Uncharacterized membrane-anchored protein [Poseidonocella sedimentorum]
MPIEDHPRRFELANELHARPFPKLTAPAMVHFVAIKQPEDAAARDRGEDRAHLLALLDRHGAAHPAPGATHHSCRIGRHRLKWEQHTEFVTYTAFAEGVSPRPFDAAETEVFPEEWLAGAPGVRMTSAMIRVEPRPAPDRIEALVAEWFVAESVAVSSVLDDTAVIAGDFRIDAGGHLRFAVFSEPEANARRVGRIVQRLCEVETYKTMSMLGLARAREMSAQMGALDTRLTQLMDRMTSQDGAAEETLRQLLAISAELESLSARAAFRFGATGAYEALVLERIKVLREVRFDGRQTFAEFMLRRFDPAMRTVKSTEARLGALANRAIRAAELLRTRVDVERSAQNQALLASMDRRADLQLRLQKTVEGLSVVAISYYAVSLAGYLLYPVAGWLGMSKGLLIALVTPPVVLAVLLMIRRIREKME